MKDLSYISKLMRKVGTALYYSPPITVPLMIAAAAYASGAVPKIEDLTPCLVLGTVLAATLW